MRDNILKYITISSVALILSACLLIPASIAGAASGTASLGIIPRPGRLVMNGGTFELSKSSTIRLTGDAGKLADLESHLRGTINEICDDDSRNSEKNSIMLALTSNSSLGKEGYRLVIETDMILIEALNTDGIFYGIQTLTQMLMTAEKRDGAIMLPCVEIEDKPSFEWRGFSLDTARHFVSTDFIKKTIDLLALHKMNVLHLHLTDDQAWRLEIKKYPKLTSIGAWRMDGDHPHGGFYTQDEMRDIIAYAANRHIMIVPEIEMPGHATAAIAAYPELSCEGKEISVETKYGIMRQLFCAGKEDTFSFLEDVLREVAVLFPSQYIHIGGDEAKKDKWKACKLCQQRIKDEGLEDEEALQGYFTRRIDTFVQSLGKTVIGWDEILEGKPSQTAIVQSWRGLEGALEGTEAGHRVISSPHMFTYMDYPELDEGIHVGWMLILPMKNTYTFKPAPEELTAEEKALVMGAECTIWTERVHQPEVYYKIFPRICAFSEAVWTDESRKDYGNFTQRLNVHKKRLEMLDVDSFTESDIVGNWQSGQVKDSAETLEWDVSKFITKPGYYRFTFRRDNGEGDVHIEYAALAANGIEIDRDTHPGKTGGFNEDQNYRLAVEKIARGAKYVISAKMRAEKGNGTTGTLLIRHFTPAGENKN